MTFGEWLLSARGDLPQDIVARGAKLSKGYITLLESNKRRPSIKKAVKLARAVGKSPIEALAILAGDALTKDDIALLKEIGIELAATPSDIKRPNNADRQRTSILVMVEQLPEEELKNAVTVMRALLDNARRHNKQTETVKETKDNRKTA